MTDTSSAADAYALGYQAGHRQGMVDAAKAAEPVPESVREAVKAALFDNQSPICEFTRSPRTLENMTNAAIAAYERARPRLSAEARKTIAEALAYFAGLTLNPDDHAAIAAASAELERL